MHRGLEWDDLRFVLEVGRSGSLSGAARSLGVNHSTVFRRIGQLEERLGVRLFDRLPDGYAPTAAGEALIALGGRVDDDVTALERRLAGEDLRPSGIVRVTTTDTLVPILMSACADLRRVQPDIRVELVVGQQQLNLSRRDADVALRPTRTPPEALVGRRLAGIATAAYAAESYLAEHGDEILSPRQAWIGHDDSLAHLAAAAWVRRHVAPERIVLRSNNLLGIREAARAGLGLALLPCYLAEEAPELRRLGAPMPDLVTDLWLLVHEDLRHAARIRAFMDHLADAIGSLRPTLEGGRDATAAAPAGTSPAGARLNGNAGRR